MTKEKVKEYLQKNEIDVQNANASFIVADLVYEAYVEAGKMHGMVYSPVSCYFYGNSINFYQLLDKAKVREIAHKIYDDYLKNTDSLKIKIEEHEKLTKKMDDFWQGFSKVKKVDNKELSRFYKEFVDLAHDWWHYGVIGEDKGAVISERVVPNFQNRHNISVSQAQHIVSVLSHPTEQSVLNIERIKFLELCLFLLQNAELKKLVEINEFDVALENQFLKEKVDEYLKVGFWIKTDFYDSIVITPKSLLKDASDYVLHNPIKKIEEELDWINQSAEKVRQEQEEVMKGLMVSEADEADIRFSQLTAYWIDRRKEGMMKQVYYFFLLVKEIAKRFDIAYEEINRYSVEQIYELIKDGKKSDISNFKSGGFVFYSTGEKAAVFYGKDGEDLLKIAKHIDEAPELKGMVASKGGKKIVEGTASVIFDPQKEPFKENDILITSMTRIEFVPLMRKAKAIVTNEGGIACHAAIVSRELGIPCIIGTKVATDKIKNGDTIELDLEKGIIKILDK